MSSELKPCPFCGGEASINDDPTGNGGKPITRGNIGLGRLWSVECDECGADAGYWQSEEIAVLKWNTRTPPSDWREARELLDQTHQPDSGNITAAYLAGLADGKAEARRTCRIRGGECDQCGAYVHERASTYWLPTGDGMVTEERHGANFCPNCGAKVVE